MGSADRGLPDIGKARRIVGDDTLPAPGSACGVPSKVLPRRLEGSPAASRRLRLGNNTPALDDVARRFPHTPGGYHARVWQVSGCRVADTVASHPPPPPARFRRCVRRWCIGAPHVLRTHAGGIMTLSSSPLSRAPAIPKPRLTPFGNRPYSPRD